jgi:cyclopropane fatty-acyl-phospholipid synthase-like methyltransferase
MPGPNRSVVTITVNNLQEFTDPVNYDLEEAPGSARRIEFYLALARQTGATVLDLACGTGLVALPMAEQGLRVTGVDLARPMLDHAQTKARQGRLHIDWVQADARDFDLGRRFDLVFMTGHAFQAFLTREDQDRMLSCVKHHLTAHGLFAFDNRNPSGHDLRSHAGEELWQSYIDVEGYLVTVSGLQDFDVLTQTMHWTSFRRWREDGRAVERKSSIACRFMEVHAQNALLHDHGFEIVQQFGDWDHSPMTARSEEIISICRLKTTSPG